jgi:hypothetical protein
MHVHEGDLKRDKDDFIVMRKLKSRRADWITRQDVIKLEKGEIAGYRNSNGSQGLWLHQRPSDVRPLPEAAVNYLNIQLGTWRAGDWRRRPADIPQSSFQRHIQFLEHRGLVQTRRAEGRGAPLEYMLTVEADKYRKSPPPPVEG